MAEELNGRDRGTSAAEAKAVDDPAAGQPLPDDAPPAPEANGDAHEPDDGSGDPDAFVGLELPRLNQPMIGAPPGIEPHELTRLPSTSQYVGITCYDYSPDQVLVQKVDDVEDFILHHRPEWSQVRWINVDDLGNMDVIRALADKYELHPLAIEDLLHRPQRPKVDPYPEADGRRARLFIIVRMLELHERHLRDEQISIFVGHKTILTFQESPGDVWDPIRQRLQRKGSRLRSTDASFLVYTMLDAIVDHCFPILEFYGDRLEELEDAVLEYPTDDVMHEIHAIKRELLLLRRAIWPMRDVIHGLQREPHECISDLTRTYLRDVSDHLVHMVDNIETYREVANGLTETYMTMVSQRLNDVMKTLTMISTIFIPLTFIVGIYGMNFKNMPEIDKPWGYPAVLLLCAAVAGLIVLYFRRKGWWK